MKFQKINFMYKLAKYKYIFLIFCLSILILTGVTSCGSQNDNSHEPETPESSTPLRVFARLAEVSSTKSYQEEGQVTDGTYYLSYPNTSNIYSLALVDFDNENVTPGIGIVTDSNDQELTWQNIGGNQPTFYMDNVEGSDPITVTFSSSYNPFVAGLFDKKEGTNDLLWGTLTENRNTKSLNFDLHHNMARLVVEITTDETNSPAGILNLTGATVEITNLILSPESYNRQDGTLSFKESPDYEVLTLVAPADEDTDFQGIGWGGTEEIDDNITVYTTQDFVLPPQGLKEDMERPRLRITLPNGDVYSGVIPYAMTVVNTTYPEGYPMTLSFLKEHILTLRTLVTEEPPELVFMPVQVVEWVDKGNFFMDGHQSGIYSAAEFKNLLKSLTDNNTYKLTRYGSLNIDEWTFVMWNYLNLEYDSIFGQYSGNIKFQFQFNGYGVNVISGNTSKSVNAQQLYNIVRGNLTWENIPATP